MHKIIAVMCAIFIDIHGVILPSDRSLFAVGETLLLQCNTTPPNLPVAWRSYTVATNGFVNLENDSRVTFSPPDIKTSATLVNLNEGDSGDYECFGADPKFARLRGSANDIFILPG